MTDLIDMENMSIRAETLPIESTPSIDIYSVQLPPWWAFNFLIILWGLGKLVESNLERSFTKYTALDTDKQRNVVIYVLQTIVTTLAFFLQVIGSLDIVFQRQATTSTAQYSFMIVTGQLVFLLYAWELIYRLSIGLPLLLHHLMTCLMIQLLSASLVDTLDVEYARLAILLTFYGTTEQTSFVALFLYRLDLFSKKTQNIWFTIAAIQSLFIKSLIAVVSLAYFITVYLVRGEADQQPTNWKWFWKISFIPLVVMLFAAQLYSSKILWLLKRKCMTKNVVEVDDDKEELTGKTMIEDSDEENQFPSNV